MTFQKKLVLLGITGTAVPLLLLGGFSLWNAANTATTARGLSEVAAVETVDHIVRGVYAAVTAQHELLNQTVATNLKVGDPLGLGGSLSGTKGLREAILKTKVGETGYVFVLDSKGTYVISKDGKRDGEVIWEAKDADGRPFIQEIVKKALTLRPGEVAGERYPWKNADDAEPRLKTTRIMYFAPWDWVIGAGTFDEEFHAVALAIRAANRRANFVLGTVFGLCLAGAGGFWLLFSRGMSRPLVSVAANLEVMSKGDYTGELDEGHLQRDDEIGRVARAAASLSDRLRKIVGDLAASANTVASSATELSAVSSQTAQSVHTLSSKTATVAAAAEEYSANATSVAATMDQASDNLASVSSATEEMSATISEIAANSEKARTISRQAGEQATQIASVMEQLGAAARDIGKVTETITDISSQTNLLALNATIEAARAGAAGKGFGVVANEIKGLAQQTAAATEDIKTKIGGVQRSVGGAITDVEKITGVVAEVGQIVASIAAAIEEQAAATKDVAGNIAQASAGVQETNERVAQSAVVSGTMAQDIAGVAAAAGEIHAGGEQVQSSAGELSRLAEELKELVGQFKVSKTMRGNRCGT